MALAAPGGFSRGNFDYASCVLCGGTIYGGMGWRHVVLDVAVCASCMKDPWAEEPHEVRLDRDHKPSYVGDTVARQVRAIMGLPAA